MAINKPFCLLPEPSPAPLALQWEDRFYKSNRAHTYLGKREAEFHETNNEADIYPNFPMVRGG
jgi:hypothetical protein